MKKYYIEKNGEREDLTPSELIERASELGYEGEGAVRFTSGAAEVLRKNGFVVGENEGGEDDG